MLSSQSYSGVKSLRFDCPGGGRVTYEFRDGVLPLDPTLYIVNDDGEIVEPEDPQTEAFVSKDYIKVEGVLTYSAGELGEKAAYWVNFKIKLYEPPQPNFAP